MKSSYKRILFVFAILANRLLFAAGAGDRQEIKLDTVMLSMTSDDSMEVRKVLQPSFLDSFKPYRKGTNQFGYSKKWHWLSFPVTNASQDGKRYMMVTQSTFIHFYDFVLVDPEGNRIVKQVHTGVAYPFMARDVKNRYFVFSFQIPANSTYRVYTRVHNDAGNLIQPIRLFTEKGYQEWQPINNLLTSSALSLLLLGVVVSLFLLSSFFERIYYYYACYLLGVFFYFASYEGFTYQYLWPNSLFLADISRMFYLPSIIYMFYFVIRILSSESGKLTRLRKIGKYLVVVVVFLAIVCCIPGYLFPQRNQVTIIMNMFVLGLMLLTVFALVIKLRQGYKPAYLLSVAFVPGIIYGVIMIMNYWGVISINRNSYFVQYGLSFCTLSEMCILLWMLLFRFKNIQRLQRLSSERMLLYMKLASKTDRVEERENVSYVNSKYDKAEIEELCAKIRSMMDEDRPYLDEELNLNKLASQLSCPPHMLSQCINQMEGRNFNDFINQYRLKEAMKMLTDHKYSGFSVEGIGLEAGFSSKTTFYTAFKKQTGTTPTEYRKSYRMDN